MPRPSRIAIAPALAAALAATPAAAHPGAHASFSLTGLLAHLAEPDHLALLALAAIVGRLAWRRARHAPAAGATVEARSERRHDPR